MEYTATHTAMMDVIANLNNRIIPVNLPYEYESFLTSEVVNGIIEAMNYNLNYKPYHSYQFNHIQEFEGKYTEASIFYYPFEFPEYRESHQLPYDFLFTLENSSLGFYENYPLSTKLKKIEDKNRVHRLLHILGYEPYSFKNSLGLYETFATKKDHPTNPINAKTCYIDDSPNDTNLREAFGFAPRKPWSSEPGVVNEGAKFTIGSSINLDDVIHSTIRFFRAVSFDGLIIKPGADGIVEPYHNKTLYYANPHYGYYDDFYRATTFWGGGYDSNGNSLINGTAYACGFKVVWFTDTEFWIILKYKLVYTDKRPIQQYDPTLCCLAQCFGITN